MPIPKSMATYSSLCDPAANYTPLGARVERVAILAAPGTELPFIKVPQNCHVGVISHRYQAAV
jgi:hypothetical protein